MSPSTGHEEDAQTNIVLIEVVAGFSSTRLRNVGSMTYRRRDLDRGFEPDASFCVQNEPRVRDRDQIDLAVDPPPDLVLETGASRSAVDKLALFAAMGIPKGWRCDGRRVRIVVLAGDSYRETGASLALPVLTSDALTRFLAESWTRLRPDWFRMVGDRARAPRPTNAPS